MRRNVNLLEPFILILLRTYFRTCLKYPDIKMPKKYTRENLNAVLTAIREDRIPLIES